VPVFNKSMDGLRGRGEAPGVYAQGGLAPKGALIFPGTRNGRRGRNFERGFRLAWGKMSRGGLPQGGPPRRRRVGMIDKRRTSQLKLGLRGQCRGRNMVSVRVDKVNPNVKKKEGAPRFQDRLFFSTNPIYEPQCFFLMRTFASEPFAEGDEWALLDKTGKTSKP